MITLSEIYEDDSELRKYDVKFGKIKDMHLYIHESLWHKT